MPASAVLELESKPAAHPLIYTESEAALISDVYKRQVIIPALLLSIIYAIRWESWY